MTESKPEWYRVLQNDPFARRTFTMEKMERIGEKAAAEERMRSRISAERRYVWPIAAVCVAAVIGIGIYQGAVGSSGHLPSANSPEQTVPAIETLSPTATNPATQTAPPTLTAPPSTGDVETVYLLKTDVQALPNPEAYTVMPAVFMAQPDTAYKVMERKGMFVRIAPAAAADGPTGWIPEWYLNPDGDAVFEKTAIYMMIVSTPVAYRLFPDEPKPSGFELEAGKVLQVTGRYGAWLRVNIVTYDSPYEGDKWVPESALSDYDPAKAKEGFLNPGAVVYNDNGEVIDPPPAFNPIFIAGESGDRYRIGSIGGYTGLIGKKDFLPGPFLRVVDQSGK